MLIYDTRGYIQPYTLINVQQSVIHTEFVLPYSNSTTREALHSGYLQYNKDLQIIVQTSYEQWVDGSFATQKVSPRDVDIVTFLDYEMYESNITTLDRLQGGDAIAAYGVDAYFVPVFPENHKYRQRYTSDRAYWLDHFGHTRPTRETRVKGKRFPKGIIQINY